MGLGKYSPNDAINGDMGWKPPCDKQWRCVFRHWARCYAMSTDRVNYKVFRWAFRNAVRDRPFSLKRGGGMVFCFVENFFFGKHKR